MFNIDRFHNRLALSLGYRRIVYERRFDIVVDNERSNTVPLMTLKIKCNRMNIAFYASEVPDRDEWEKVLSEEQRELVVALGIKDDVLQILHAVHSSYIDAKTFVF